MMLMINIQTVALWTLYPVIPSFPMASLEMLSTPFKYFLFLVKIFHIPREEYRTEIGWDYALSVCNKTVKICKPVGLEKWLRV